MDFIRVGYRENKDGTREYYPSLQALESTDLVCRGGAFLGIYDEETGLYSRKLANVPEIIDRAFAKEIADRLRPGDTVKKVRVYENQLFTKLIALMRNIGDMGPDLDQKLIFADQTPTKADAATFKMGYTLSDAPPQAWEELVSVLYAPQERQKIEWAIGSIFSGDAATQIQKFYVFFGRPGEGKSTIINIIQGGLFAGHSESFSASKMGRSDSDFSLEPFKYNPLVAIDPDGDLSKIETNENLNSITGHDRVTINVKGKNLFSIVPRSTLFISSNSPVKITDRKAGVFRRLIDIQPTGRVIPEAHYHEIMKRIQFELGSIAQHCINVYRSLGPTYFSSYRATDMMFRTNDVFNFVEDNRLLLARGISVKNAFQLYSQWCEETQTRNVFKQYQFRDLLFDYFENFEEQVMIDGVRHRSYFSNLKELETFGWNMNALESGKDDDKEEHWLTLKDQPSKLDVRYADMPAQLATPSGLPSHAWDEVFTKLGDIDTRELHYVRIPEHEILLDFDLGVEDGEEKGRDLDRNVRAASEFPPTYAETSKSGGGLHLHYVYEGDVSRLASTGVTASGEPYEIKVLPGKSSLRRKLTLCNDHDVATISSGLPLKEEKVISQTAMTSELSIRKLILRALNKEIHGYTKPNVDFIKQVLDDAKREGIAFNVSDMYDDIFAFAMGSNNQRQACLAVVAQMEFSNVDEIPAEEPGEAPIVIFDCEVFPNLFVISWMFDEDTANPVSMINPSASEVEALFKFRLVGYNNRHYDNHILWAASLGYDNQALYDLSSRIISGDRKAMFGAAYNLAYADLYDILSEKKSLKAWEIELGLKHHENDLPWDEPVPEDRVLGVADYCEDDVRGTRGVLKAREGDFKARQILAELSGLQVCNTNRQHTEQLIFGDVKDPSPDLVYTDLRETFPGYEFNQFAPPKEKSVYKGELVGEGGRVKSIPGTYTNVALLDIASMHPASIIAMNMFGKYTPRFKELMDARLAIKHNDLENAATFFDGRLAPYVKDPAVAEMLAYALKIVINSVYGLTKSAHPTRFKDSRNIDNIAAKRGALFMVDLEEFVASEGFEVVHTKTDSVKIPNATPEIIEKVKEFGARYGYTFEHEATFWQLALFNDAVYVAHYKWAQKESKIDTWDAVGAQFQHPVVFKTLLSGEALEPEDFVEVKQVSKGVMYLETPETGARQFQGRFGAFIPVVNGRRLLRVDGEKEAAVAGTKGYLWELDETALSNQLEVDMSYFEHLIQKGRESFASIGFDPKSPF